MKKTFTINLNHLVYNIDEDAYEVLKQYLLEVEEQLFEDERKEVMGDIETRVSELFEERLLRGKQVINLADVEEIIAILGKPNAYNEQQETDAEETATSEKTKKKTKATKKLYRDVDNRMLGGVAAGIAVYLGWDVVWIRLILILLVLFVWGTLIPIYFVLWLIVPGAKTVSQKLEMQGENVTAERIKEEFQNVKDYVESEDFKESTMSIGQRLGEVFLVLVKVFASFIGIIIGIVGFSLLIALLLSFTVWLFNPELFVEFIPDYFNYPTYKAIILVISSLLIVFIPIFSLLVWAFRSITGSKSKSSAWGWVIAVIWFIAILLFTGITSNLVVKTLPMWL